MRKEQKYRRDELRHPLRSQFSALFLHGRKLRSFSVRIKVERPKGIATDLRSTASKVEAERETRFTLRRDRSGYLARWTVEAMVC